MTKNTNQHSKTNYIEIQYHIVRDHYEKDDIEIDYISTNFQLANIFTKPLDYNGILSRILLSSKLQPYRPLTAKGHRTNISTTSSLRQET